jgi:hypothetical protein
MNKKNIFTLLIICIVMSINAQSGGDVIDPKNFDVPRVKILFYEKLNAYRAVKKVQTLAIDVTLEKAAKMQSSYCAQNSSLSHYQEKNKLLYSPKDRTVAAKGQYSLVGENVLMSYVGVMYRDKHTLKNHTIVTYADLAESMLQQWIHSPPHHQNIINPAYSHSGIDMDLLPNGTIYANHVFASAPFSPPRNKIKYSDTVYGISELNNLECDKLLGEQEYIAALLASYLSVEGDSVFLHYMFETDLKKLIRKKEDGLALDIVSRDQFRCSGENALHPSYVFDGKLLTPVYQENLYKNDRYRSDEFESFVGILPNGYDPANMQLNLIILKSNSVCSYSYPLSVYSKDLPTITMRPYFVQETGILKKDTADYTKVFKIPFDRNGTKQSQMYFETLKDIIHLYKNSIRSIEINAYSSIEGTEEKNKTLSMQRADFLESIITKEGFPSSRITKTAIENWDEMYRQLDSLHLTELKLLGKDLLRNAVNKSLNGDNKSDEFEYFLDEQRVAEIKLKIFQVYDDQVTSEQLPVVIDHTFRTKKVDQSTIALYRMIEAMISGKLNEKYFMVLNLPDILLNPKASNNYLAFLIKYANQMYSGKGERHMRLTSDQIDFMNQALKHKSLYQPLNFNIAVLKTLYYEGGYSDTAFTFESIASNIRAIEKDTTLIPKKYIDHLWYNYYLTGSVYYYTTHRYRDMYACFDKVKTYLLLNELSEKEVEEVALYFNGFAKYIETIYLLDKYLEKYPRNKKLVLLYVSTGAIFNTNYKHRLEYFYSQVDKLEKLDHAALCTWYKINFQILREDALKVRFCKYCGEPQGGKN